MVVIRRKKDLAEKTTVDFREGQKVALLIFSQTKMGFVAVINGTHKGVLYQSEVFQPLEIGQKINGYIKKVRDDNKIDLCLQKPGYIAIDPQLRKIMDALQQQGGFIAVTDKSPPEVISDLFGISKKAFKKTIGNLYKKRLITLEQDGIRLQEKIITPARRPNVSHRKSAARSSRG
jgi:predicted RNA-binding protein (virulence factor B family)